MLTFKQFKAYLTKNPLSKVQANKPGVRISMQSSASPADQQTQAEEDFLNTAALVGSTKGLKPLRVKRGSNNVVMHSPKWYENSKKTKKEEVEANRIYSELLEQLTKHEDGEVQFNARQLQALLQTNWKVGNATFFDPGKRESVIALRAAIEAAQAKRKNGGAEPEPRPLPTHHELFGRDTRRSKAVQTRNERGDWVPNTKALVDFLGGLNTPCTPFIVEEDGQRCVGVRPTPAATQGWRVDELNFLSFIEELADAHAKSVDPAVQKSAAQLREFTNEYFSSARVAPLDVDTLNQLALAAKGLGHANAVAAEVAV